MKKVTLVNDKSSEEKQEMQWNEYGGKRKTLLDQTVKESFLDLWSEIRMTVSHDTSIEEDSRKRKEEEQDQMS